MDRIMHLLAPKGWVGFGVRFVLLIGCVAAGNIVFAYFFDTIERQEMRQPSFYIMHALLVGGPFIMFFLAVSVFQVRLQRKLWRLSRKDGLTGLNNRRTFFETLDRLREKETTGILLMLDADRFKRINDTYGHQAGDACLKSISRQLRQNIRSGDIIARLGGEEFAIYLKDASIETAQAIGTRLTKPITFSCGRFDGLSITLSVGAARSFPGLSIDAVYAQADLALYEVKQRGGAGYALANHDPPAGVERQSA